MKHVPPREIRELRAEMALRAIRTKDLSQRARMSLSKTSMLLNGRLIAPDALERLRALILSTPYPKH